MRAVITHIFLQKHSGEQVHHSSDPEWPDENYKLFDVQKRTILAIILSKIGRHVTKFLT